MRKIGLVTDSTADLSKEIQRQFNVHVIPLKIHFGGQTYHEGELSPDQFFLRLETSLQLPTTSPPEVQEFREFYRPLLEKYDDLISLHISVALSQTAVFAKQAAATLGGRVHVVDTKTLSLGLGLLVLEAAEGIGAGLEVPAVLKRIATARENNETFVALDTLTYLEKGGRIGRLTAMVGSLLNMKPIIRIAEDGVLSPVGRAFSREKILVELVLALKEAQQGRRVIAGSVYHGAAPEAGSRLLAIIAREFGITPLYGQIGAVVGTHAGPGCVGVALIFN